MDPATQASNRSSGSFPWKPVLVRCALFVGGGIAGLTLLLVVCLVLSFGVGDGTIRGGPLVSLLFALIPIGGMAGGVLLVGRLERRKKSDPFPGEPAAIAAAQKVLLVAIALQLLAGVIRSGFYLLLYWGLGAIGVFLVAHALGSPSGRQIGWLVVTGLLGIIRWSAGLLGREQIDEAAVFFLGILGLLIGLVAMLILNKKATSALRKAGLKVGFLGVPVIEFPTLGSAAAMPAAPDDVSSGSPPPLHPGHAPSSPPESTTSFFYLGPNNEPIGPISSDVLLQLRESGVVNYDTLVAQEGDSGWKPLRSFLEVAEESES